MVSSQVVADIQDRLRRKGYAVVDLPDRDAIEETRQRLAGMLGELLGAKDVELETYHQRDLTDEQHYEIHVKMTGAFRREAMSRALCARQLDLFIPLLGKDLAITVPDVLRMVRPHKHHDNIGYHRDTDYGNTAYELNVWIPLVQITEDMALRVVPGSHNLRKEDLELTRSVHELVTEGSDLHKIGFFHAPQHIVGIERFEFVPVPIEVGQALVFPANLIHGQEQNQGPWTRWSTDFELGNSLGPIQWQHASRDHLKYRVLTESYCVGHGREFGPDTGVPAAARVDAIQV